MKTPKKRKLQRKTNYSTRLKLLKAGKNRVVIRKTNKYLNVQYVESHEAKDKVIVSFSSKDLLKHGLDKSYKGSLKSIPAAYLTGYLAGKEIIKKDPDNESILDIGLQRKISGGRLFSVLKGLVDSGLKIKYNEKVFPKVERIEGKHLKENIQKEFEKIKQTITK